MKTNNNFIRLSTHILSLSKATTWEAALPEWQVGSVSISENVCPCGVPIKLNCHIHNTVTGQQTIVGSTCVKRFLNIETVNEVNIDSLFAGLVKLQEDPTRCPSKAVIAYAKNSSFLYESEEEFLLKIVNKKELSEKQEAWRSKIVRRILQQITVSN